jgi:hypothetical protein
MGSHLQPIFMEHQVKHRFSLPIVSQAIKYYHAINIQGETQFSDDSIQGESSLIHSLCDFL